MTTHRGRVALYARVSTSGQEPETQLMALREYVQSRGWRVVEEFVDVGISGAKEHRPALSRMMDAARRRRCDVVLVWKFDRLARSSRHLLNTLEELRIQGVDFVSLTEAVDTSSPAGKMMFSLVAAFSEFERSLIRERVLAGLQRAKSQGKRLGRPKAAPEGDPGALRASGLTVRAIAQRLGVSKSWVADWLSKNPSQNGSLASVGGQA